MLAEPVPVDPAIVLSNPMHVEPGPVDYIQIQDYYNLGVLVKTIPTAPVDPDPDETSVNPICITTFINTVLDPVRAAFMNPVPTDFIAINVNQSVSCAPASPIRTTLVAPVHIDPVSVASANPNPITFIIKKLSLHQISIHLAHVKSLEFFRVRWREVLDRERGRSLFRGGALVVVSSGSLLWCQGSLRGFRSPCCLVWSVCL